MEPTQFRFWLKKTFFGVDYRPTNFAQFFLGMKTNDLALTELRRLEQKLLVESRVPAHRARQAIHGRRAVRREVVLQLEMKGNN